MSDKIQPKPQGMSSQLNSPPSLTIIAELTKERVAGQLTQVNALDSKANFVLGAATALVSAALILQANLLAIQSASSLLTTNLFRLLPLAILTILYLSVMIFAFLAYRIREYKQAPDPETLYENYLYKDEEDTKAAVYRAVLEAYKKNVKIIGRKVRYLNFAFAFLALEAVALALVLILQIIR